VQQRPLLCPNRGWKNRRRNEKPPQQRPAATNFPDRFFGVGIVIYSFGNEAEPWFSEEAFVASREKYRRIGVRVPIKP
jgi:hypothetical protein